ncbi:MAG TPA: hypothetical protein VF241_01990 [Propionibacteriaceae bacterium]
MALDVLVRRRERAKRERRLNGLAVERLTALGERDSAMRDPSRVPAWRFHPIRCLDR